MKSRLTLTRKILLGVLAVTLAAVSTVGATDVFTDVPTGKFYHDPVGWAAANGITTGTSPTTFDPERGVTRGESVTFLKRYDDNIVQPAITDLEAADAGMYTKAEVDAAIAAAVSALPRVHWGRFSSAGVLEAGSAGVSATNEGAGLYDVTFPESVADCAVFVSLHARSSTIGLLLIALGYTSEGYAVVTDNTSTTDGVVRVVTYIQTAADPPTFATATNLPFVVQAIC